jgi:ATP-dependent Clp protease ATP-binding subunit ClpA
MIAALVHRFENKDETWATDFIQSKGEGRIFLLHGPSGVGKTYTAECIAEFTGENQSSLSKTI